MIAEMVAGREEFGQHRKKVHHRRKDLRPRIRF